MSLFGVSIHNHILQIGITESNVNIVCRGTCGVSIMYLLCINLCAHLCHYDFVSYIVYEPVMAVHETKISNLYFKTQQTLPYEVK